jgi:hypothetical protein
LILDAAHNEENSMRRLARTLPGPRQSGFSSHATPTAIVVEPFFRRYCLVRLESNKVGCRQSQFANPWMAEKQKKWNPDGLSPAAAKLN